MQTVLLATEFGNLMAWDGRSKADVDRHFSNVSDTLEMLTFLGGNIDITYVFKVVILATLQSSKTKALTKAYSMILDNLEDSHDLSLGGPPAQRRADGLSLQPRLLRRPGRALPRVPREPVRRRAGHGQLHSVSGELRGAVGERRAEAGLPRAGRARRRAQRVGVRVRRALGAGPAVLSEEAEAAETVRLRVAPGRRL